VAAIPAAGRGSVLFWGLALDSTLPDMNLPAVDLDIVHHAMKNRFQQPIFRGVAQSLNLCGGG
jgi:hypothetical protein